MTKPFQLSDGQQTALDQFVAFLLNPSKIYFVLEGYAGTGKSTLVKHLMDQLPSFMMQLKEKHPDSPAYEIALTATTNKAAEVLSTMSGMDVATIHKFLGLRVFTDYKTGVTKLTVNRNVDIARFKLLFIDEASFIDYDLLRYIAERTEHCKIVFMGDRGQLSPVGLNGVPPVFTKGYDGAMLTEVMRQMVDGVPKANPVTDLATGFRLAVTSGEWPKIKNVDSYITVLDPQAFEEAIKTEFTREDWRYSDSKVLGWTNKCVIGYNHMIGELVTGTPHLEVNDYAVSNKAVIISGGGLKTDELVQITHMEEPSEEHGCPGRWITVNDDQRLFFPESLEAKNEAYKRAKARDYFGYMREIDQEWVDLRHAFAQTVNKSQGSTYDRVYIDLADIMRCNVGEQCARMLYVAVSRARFEVIFKKGK